MKKDRLITIILCIIVTFLTCWFFWAVVGRNFIEGYIKENYGQEIMRTFDNTELIKNFNLPLKNDKGKS